MKNIKIVKANKTDIQALVELENSAFKSDRFTAADFKRHLKSSSLILLVVKHEQTLIAKILILLRSNSTIARLYSLAVLPAFRRKGVAHKLYNAVEKKLKRQHITELRLEVRKNNRHAINLYKQNGYEIFGEYENFYSDNMNALRMRKKLTRVKLK